MLLKRGYCVEANLSLINTLFLVFIRKRQMGSSGPNRLPTSWLRSLRNSRNQSACNSVNTDLGSITSPDVTESLIIVIYNHP